MVKANSQVLADKTFLQDDPVIEKLPKHPCTTGIKNLGYTCFLSSTVQCLAHCQELRDYILRNTLFFLSLTVAYYFWF